MVIGNLSLYQTNPGSFFLSLDIFQISLVGIGLVIAILTIITTNIKDILKTRYQTRNRLMEKKKQLEEINKSAFTDTKANNAQIDKIKKQLEEYPHIPKYIGQSGLSLLFFLISGSISLLGIIYNKQNHMYSVSACGIGFLIIGLVCYNFLKDMEEHIKLNQEDLTLLKLSNP